VCVCVCVCGLVLLMCVLFGVWLFLEIVELITSSHEFTEFLLFMVWYSLYGTMVWYHTIFTFSLMYGIFLRVPQSRFDLN
jgi:hypothetical protein